MTHAERLREIADEHIRLAFENHMNENTYNHYCAIAESLRAAADWCERVPHEEDCPIAEGLGRCVCGWSEYWHAPTFTRVGGKGQPCTVYRPSKCNCFHSEQAP